MKKPTALFVFAGSAVLVFGLAVACGVKADAPEPAPENIVDGKNTHVIRMPNGFRNVAVTCYGTTGVYVTSRGWSESSTGQGGSGDSLPSGITVLANDPSCGPR